MAETQTKKKNKKGKKKVVSNPAPNILVGNQVNNNSTASNSTPNSTCHNHNESTVQKMFNFINPDISNQIEVSVVPESLETFNDDSAVNSSQVVNNKKKKKSKKKSKEETKETEGPQNLEKDNSNPSLLNFSENGIHLVNHPEISVTFTNVTTTKNGDKEINEKNPSTPEEKIETRDSYNSSKKKKKKKNKVNDNPEAPPQAKMNPPQVKTNPSQVKNNQPQVKNNQPQAKNNSSQMKANPSQVSSAENTGTIVTPTYTKVVMGNDSCVLLVNNENLAAAAKTYGNMEDDKTGLNESKVHFQEKKNGDVLISNKFNPDANNQLGKAVSIFPVLANGEENNSEKKKLSQPCVERVSSILKKDGEDASEKENPQDSALTKAQLKAERRAKQEAQRAAKLAKNNTKPDSDNISLTKNIKPTKELLPPKKSDDPTSNSVVEKTAKPNPVAEKDSFRKVRLFSHLPQCRQLDVNSKVHPAILEVGSQYNKGIICGSNARCVALFAALREVIQDYAPLPNKKFCRELESNIQTYLSFLNNCRPLSVSMINAVKFLKHQINHMPPEVEDDKAKEILSKFIYDFVNDEILLAKEAISSSASAKIVDGDVILVFSHSSLVKDVLCKAHSEYKTFRVLVADSRPKLEGLEMLRSLVRRGLQCSYISINAVSYVMKEVSKVIIGAHALLSNGCVMSRLGSKQIALVASSYSVPVLVCCETYKFCERVLTDSFVHNELGEPEDIACTSLVLNDSLKNWQDIPSLQLLNLFYDVTPPDLISMVITEKGVLPCTSVPVVLRVRYAGLHE